MQCPGLSSLSSIFLTLKSKHLCISDCFTQHEQQKERRGHTVQSTQWGVTLPAGVRSVGLAQGEKSLQQKTENE